jgi:EAL domain-containing protein (putative c-di-GMP-specific phosphodiesterase class I)
MMLSYGVEHGDLELEITESALMYDPEGALKLLHQFADLNVNLAIDDFGT